jgi:hypothetical protein
MSQPESTKRGLLDIEAFVIPSQVLLRTIQFLRDVGRSGSEGFVLWGGKIEEITKLRFTNALVPGQQSFSTPDGLLVTVPGDALFNVNKLLHERGEILAAQVHIHPSSAYHSETDDHYPMVTLLGSLSIVIPDFARNAPSDIAAWAWYRLKEYSVWAPLEQQTKVIFE